MSINETAALGLHPNAARDSEKTLQGSYRKAALQSTPRRLRPAGEDLALVLAADLAAVFGREAPEVSLAALGRAIIFEAQRREARP